MFTSTAHAHTHAHTGSLLGCASLAGLAKPNHVWGEACTHVLDGPVVHALGWPQPRCFNDGQTTGWIAIVVRLRLEAWGVGWTPPPHTHTHTHMCSCVCARARAHTYVCVFFGARAERQDAPRELYIINVLLQNRPHDVVCALAL